MHGRRTRLRRVIVSAAVAVIAAAIAGPFRIAGVGASGGPQPITIHIQKPVGAGTTGAFQASGALTDSGTVVNNDFDRHVAAYPTNETLEISATLFGSGGNLTVQMEIRVTQSGEPGIEYEDGRWQLVAGTGAYAGLQGEGDETAVVDHNQGEVWRSLTGEVH
jgi:hypothetical protein